MDTLRIQVKCSI